MSRGLGVFAVLSRMPQEGLDLITPRKSEFKDP